MLNGRDNLFGVSTLQLEQARIIFFQVKLIHGDNSLRSLFCTLVIAVIKSMTHLYGQGRGTVDVARGACLVFQKHGNSSIQLVFDKFIDFCFRITRNNSLLTRSIRIDDRHSTILPVLIKIVVSTNHFYLSHHVFLFCFISKLYIFNIDQKVITATDLSKVIIIGYLLQTGSHRTVTDALVIVPQKVTITEVGGTIPIEDTFFVNPAIVTASQELRCIIFRLPSVGRSQCVIGYGI